jgi:hypothetical protein
MLVWFRTSNPFLNNVCLSYRLHLFFLHLMVLTSSGVVDSSHDLDSKLTQITNLMTWDWTWSLKTQDSTLSWDWWLEIIWPGFVMFCHSFCVTESTWITLHAARDSSHSIALAKKTCNRLASETHTLIGRAHCQSTQVRWASGQIADLLYSYKIGCLCYI